MPDYHNVDQGECLAVIADAHGFTDYHAIWDDGNNAQLKSKRPNANVLAPGDILYIPDKADKDESRGTGASHSFAVGDSSVKYRVIIKDAKGQPIAGANYTLQLPNQLYTGVTGGDGLIEQPLPLDAESGTLTLTDLNVAWTLSFGHLDPFDTVSGAQGRLKNLGYDPGPVDGSDNDTFHAALSAFQKDNALTVDGTCSAETQAKLQDLHGC